MNAAHLHLIFVHWPIVGCPIVLMILALAQKRDSRELRHLGYLLLIALAGAGLVAFYSGPSAFELLEKELAAERVLVEDHALLGRAAFLCLVVLAVLALQAWLIELQKETPPAWLRWLILGGTAAVCFLLFWSGSLGGQIRHPEVRPAFEAIELDPG